MESRSTPYLTRRGFMAVAAASTAGAAAACAPAASAPGPVSQEASAKTGWEQQWDELVAAARKEGRLVLATMVGAQYRQFVETFEAAFPGIAVEHTGMVASQLVPRILQERKGELYTFDVLMSSTTTPLINLRPESAIEPVRDVIFRPDVLDDKSWSGGFEAGFLDNDKKWMYALCSSRTRVVWINTDEVNEGEIKSIEDLLNPKWKGKILSGDLRNYGGGAWPATVTRLSLGDDIIKRLWKDQEVTLSRELRQLMDFMVQGKYAIGYGAVSDGLLPDYLEKGLGKNLKYIPIDNADYLSANLNNAFIMNRAPHPNAARLFINWALTKEGSTSWAKAAASNSRRTDVPPTLPEMAPPAGKQYITIDTEAMLPEVEKTYAIAKQVLG